MRDTRKKKEKDTAAAVSLVLASVNAAFYEPFLQYIAQEKGTVLQLAAVYAEDPKADAYVRFLNEGIPVRPLSAEDIINELLYLQKAVLLLDIDLPGIDSLSVIQELYRRRLSERIVVVSEFLSSLHKAAFSAIPIGYYMRLPVSFPVLHKRILECGQGCLPEIVPKTSDTTGLKKREAFCVAESDLKNPSGNEAADEKILLKTRTTQLLHEIGIPANLCGHEYLREAIIMIAGDCEVYGKMTKVIYPSIAKKYAKSCSSVEKAIRTALDVAWMRGKTELLDHIFGFTVNMQKGRPTNSEFIALMADYLWTSLHFTETA